MEIVYLYGDTAMMRVKAANTLVTATSSSEKIVFLLVRAHWEGKPSLVNLTGDAIDSVLVNDVRMIGFLDDKKAAFGESDSHGAPFFIVSNGIVKTYEDKSAFERDISNLDLARVVLGEPEAVFKEQTKN